MTDLADPLAVAAAAAAAGADPAGSVWFVLAQGASVLAALLLALCAVWLPRRCGLGSAACRFGTMVGVLLMALALTYVAALAHLWPAGALWSETAGLVGAVLFLAAAMLVGRELVRMVRTSRSDVERRAAALDEQTAAYRRLELALKDSPITVFEQDADLRYTFLHNPPPGTAADTFLGLTDAEVFDERDLRRLEPVKRRVIETGERATVELELAIGEARRFYVLRLEPKGGGPGKVEGIVGTAFDLTERRRHEQTMGFVMRELTHRSKNLLAVVQAIARKTASTAADTDSFIRDFSSRLRAIAAAHDLLVDESWSGAGLRHLLAASLSQTVDPDAPGIVISGPDLKLGPEAAQMLGLAFHELTTNAAAHGALSVPGGRVAVGWRRDGDTVRLSWREEGGPAVVPPLHSGFGRVLLERLVGASLDGTVALEFRPEGLVCDVSFPVHRLIAA